MLKDFKRQILMPITLATIVMLPTSLVLADEAKKLPHTVNVTLLTASDMDTMTGDIRGGAARLAAVVKAERAANKHLVYSFPGDLLSPSIMGGFDKGAHMVELLNMAPPDILAPGNHEFDFGQENFLKQMAEGNFTKLGANIRWGDGKQVDGLQDTRMFEFDGIKIGFLGLTTEDTINISSPGDIKFLSTIDTAKTNAAALREQGADIVVAVVHTAQAVDFDLMNRAGIDVVQSGHDHNLHIFYDGKRALVEAKEEAEYVVAMDIEFTISEKAGKRRVKWWPNFRIIDTATVTPDPEVAAVVQGYADTLSKELDVEIGKTMVELDSRKASVRTAESPLGSLIIDAMRAAVDADIGFTNGGGIRGNKVYEPETMLTRRDVLTELPFGNSNIKIEITGKTLIDVLEHAARKMPETNGGFMHVSGMTFTINLSKAVGSRISDVMIGGTAVEMDKIYTAATNDFIGKGGDGYKMLKPAKRLIDASGATLMANDVMVYIRKMTPIEPKLEGRIKIAE